MVHFGRGGRQESDKSETLFTCSFFLAPLSEHLEVKLRNLFLKVNCNGFMQGGEDMRNIREVDFRVSLLPGGNSLSLSPSAVIIRTFSSCVGDKFSNVSGGRFRIQDYNDHNYLDEYANPHLYKIEVGPREPPKLPINLQDSCFDQNPNHMC